MFTIMENGIIHSPEGIPCAPRLFSDGRVNCAVDENGLVNVNYFIKTGEARSSWVFLRTLFDGLRWFVRHHLCTYKLLFGETYLAPYGLSSTSVLEIEGVSYSFRQEIALHHDSIVIRITADPSFRGTVQLEFNQNFCANVHDPNDCSHNLGATQRVWSPWTFQDGQTLFGRYDDTMQSGKKSSCAVYISADSPCGYQHKSFKHILTLPLDASKSTASFALNFRPAEESFDVTDYFSTLDENLQKQKERYAAVIAAKPILKTSHPMLDAFFSIAPLYHESAKATDCKGAVKANNFIYWVWGWDGITATEAYGYWKDISFACDMLAYYDLHKSETSGIAHSLKYDNSFGGGMAAPAQGLYLTLLYYCYSMTGDETLLDRYYPYARRIVTELFQKSMDTETGYLKGTSLIPDFPEFTQETGNDLSTFNNMIAYCALRSIEKLANHKQDTAFLNLVHGYCQKMEENFDRLFFDPARKFYVASIDSVTHEQRKVHILSSVKFENLFLDDLIYKTRPQTAEFMEDCLMGPFGLRDLPLDSPAYDGDANQLHCWWPVHSEYFINTVNAQNKGHLLETFAGYIEYWTRQLMCPEGISYALENAGEQDRWNCTSGIFQSYSVRGWYQAVVHGIVGIKSDSCGINFFPYDGEELSLCNLCFRGKKVNFHKKGKGPYLAFLELNGEKIFHQNRISYDRLKDCNEITMVCTETPYSAGHLILAQELQVRCIRKCLFELSGNATSAVSLYGDGSEQILLNGVPLDVTCVGHLLHVSFFAEIGKTYLLEIRTSAKTIAP